MTHADITVEAIKAAFQKTGLKPATLNTCYNNKACAMGALAVANGADPLKNVPLSFTFMQQFGVNDQELRSLCNGWDGLCNFGSSEKLYGVGVEAARILLEGETE